MLTGKLNMPFKHNQVNNSGMIWDPSINTPYPSPQVSPMCSNRNVILWQKKALWFPHKHLETLFISYIPQTICVSLSLVTTSATRLFKAHCFLNFSLISTSISDFGARKGRKYNFLYRLTSSLKRIPTSCKLSFTIEKTKKNK